MVVVSPLCAHQVWGSLSKAASKYTVVTVYKSNNHDMLNNQAIKIKDMDTNHDNRPSGLLLTRLQLIVSLSGGKTQAQPVDGTTLVGFALQWYGPAGFSPGSIVSYTQVFLCLFHHSMS